MTGRGSVPEFIITSCKCRLREKFILAMKCLPLLGLILLALGTNGALEEVFRWKQVGYRDLPAGSSKFCNQVRFSAATLLSEGF